MLTLTVPGLLARGTQALAATAPFRSFARYADPPVLRREGSASALCAALGLPHTTPLASLSALGADLPVDDRYMIAATPVTLVADRDIVMLAGRVQDLGDDDAAILIDLLNRHFGNDDVFFIAARPATWFARCERAFSLSTSPLDAAIGRSIYSYLPRGADGNTWQRWQVEIQMLLHEHAVNQQRDARGLLPVSSVWLWGNGRLSDMWTPTLAPSVANDAAALPPMGEQFAPGDGPAALMRTPTLAADTRVFAAADESGDFVRGLARHVGLSVDALPATLSAILDGLNNSPNAIVALASLSDESAIERFGADWLQPAVTALEAGKVDALRLIADGHGAAVSWVARRPSPFARVTSRLRARPFEIPALAPE